MTLGDVIAGFCVLAARADREEVFIGGIREAVDTIALILTSVMTRLMAGEQISATNVLKSEQMEGYLAGNRQEMAEAPDKINANDVAQDNQMAASSTP